MMAETDLIKRSGAIEAIDNIDWYHQNANKDMVSGANPDTHQAWYKAEDVYNALESVPSAQPEPRWIPCSERLPEVGKDVMVCYDFKGHRSVLIGVLYYGDEKFHGYDDEYLTPEGRKYRKAVAWMPLPEPYREDIE